MKICRLRLLGFKSFVEPTELLIEPGLTGVVGPNGCGKSNLLEALRWVMGETSYKSMRASSMDDVIFSGTTQRPARNSAEVTIFVDNAMRTAPAEFNDADVIEITRHIERESGSNYRVNGREVRARDVKILFEDAATGARSPALVRQGQIAEIVNAKPDQRRRVLEDAAGIAGLHSRRHEAELRLRAAEGNLARLDDILGQLNTQLETLKRQARQARRYKDISGDIRRAEAILLHLTWQDAHDLVLAEEGELAEALAQQGLATEAESRALRMEVEAGDALQPIRMDEAQRAAAVARLKIELANLEREAERARVRAGELQDRRQQIAADLAREHQRLEDAGEALSSLLDERQRLSDAAEVSARTVGDLKESVGRCEVDLEGAEQDHSRVTSAAIAEQAKRNSLLQRQREHDVRRQHAKGRLEAIERELVALQRGAPDATHLAHLRNEVETTEHRIDQLQDEVGHAEVAAQEASATAKTKREASRTADLLARQLMTEASTLERLLVPDANTEFPPVLDLISVTPGYEAALAAALGDDLEASLDSAAPANWRLIHYPADTPALPDGALPLSDHVKAPTELGRRLDQVGVVAKDTGRSLQGTLKPGQRLVSREGDLWRWDGFAASGEVPTAAAQRLEQRNRLEVLRGEAQHAQDLASAQTAEDLAAQQALQDAEARARELREQWRECQSQHARSMRQLAEGEKSARDFEQKSSALSAQQSAARDALSEAEQQLNDVVLSIHDLPDPATFEPQIAMTRAVLDGCRSKMLELRSALASHERECLLRTDRLDAITSERRRLESSQVQAKEHIATLEARAAETDSELESAQAIPGQLNDDRQRLLSEVQEAETARQAAADKLAAAEQALRQAQSALRELQAQLSETREHKARSEARLEAARYRRAEEARKIADAFSVEPDECLSAGGVDASEGLPSLQDIERRLQRLKADRERLGGVNLQADDELVSMTEQIETMTHERQDVEEAIAKLRAAIGRLNREGKLRLDEAFNSVNAHFQTLFTTLFGGGEARLEMIEGEDPLEGGLEIIAKPPGKKPTTLSLLSGGEQSLTALSLIFAVFLTNPSPICVLDEVDAPLDDANVDRFCTLMEKMAKDTETRFLVITHHPMTMSRMQRLFGVTMAEKGVSQLVSVDLMTAERFAEAS